MKHVLFLLLAFITIPAWGTVNEDKKEEEIKPDKSFELELWTWDEYEVPTLQTRRKLRYSRNTHGII